jgi:hypothetical protein
MESIAEHVIEPHEDRILPMSALGERWGCGSRVAARRAEEQGIPLIFWNKRVIAARLSDVLAAERKATL